MFIQMLIAICVGIAAGIFTGLSPGIHVNLISVFVIGLSSYLLKFFSLLDLCIFIVAMSVTHVFLDMIPSIFLGAPQAETALGVLPGHRYLLRGNGYMAVKLCAIGAYFSLIISIITFPLAMWVVKISYTWVSNYIGFILLGIVVFMIYRDNNKPWALIVTLIAGIFGIIVLNMPNLADPLFPMFSGLFGISTLLISLSENQNIPPQKITAEIDIDNEKTIKALSSGQFSGFLTAILPGVGASTAAIVAMQLAKKIGDHGFMILMGTINMVNFVLSIGTLYTIDKARNGTIVAVSEIIGKLAIKDIFALLFAALIAGSIAIFLSFRIGRVFAKLMQKINYQKMVVIVISIITLLIIIFTGWLGFLILIVSTAIGIIPAITKVTRTHAMACLTIPVIIYYLI